MPNPMQDAEIRCGVQPAQELLDERTLLVEKVADLKAVYGSFGTFDHLRKIELSRIKGLLRAQATRDKVTKTIPQLDEEAHEHADYIDFITTATRERAQWIRMDNAVESITALLNRGQAMIRYIASEPRAGL